MDNNEKPISDIKLLPLIQICITTLQADKNAVNTGSAMINNLQSLQSSFL